MIATWLMLAGVLAGGPESTLPAPAPTTALTEVDPSALTVKNFRLCKDGVPFTGRVVRREKNGDKKDESDIQDGFLIHKLEYYKGVKVVESYVDHKQPTRMLWWDPQGHVLGELECRKGKPWEGRQAEYGKYLLKTTDFKAGVLTHCDAFYETGKKTTEYQLEPNGVDGTVLTWNAQGELMGTLKTKNNQPWDGPLLGMGLQGTTVISRFEYKGGKVTYSIQNHLNGKKARELTYDAEGKPAHETRWDERGAVIWNGAPKPIQ